MVNSISPPPAGGDKTENRDIGKIEFGAKVYWKNKEKIIDFLIPKGLG
jgi:hypothetical protein